MSSNNLSSVFGMKILHRCSKGLWRVDRIVTWRASQCTTWQHALTVHSSGSCVCSSTCGRIVSVECIYDVVKGYMHAQVENYVFVCRHELNAVALTEPYRRTPPTSRGSLFTNFEDVRVSCMRCFSSTSAISKWLSEVNHWKYALTYTGAAHSTDGAC